MKRFFTLFFIFFLLAVNTPGHAVQALDSIVAVVNDEIISNTQLQQRINQLKQQMKQRGATLPNETILTKQVLERMIVDSIQLQMAKDQGIKIDDLSLNKMLQDIASRNKTTLDQLRSSLESDGINFERFREQTRKDMAIQQLQGRMVFSRIHVSEQEIDRFLDLQKQSGQDSSDRYHLGHILIATPEAATPEDITKAYNKAEQAIAYLRDGESFRDTALRFSQGQAALDGGDLGWRTAAQLPELFLQAIKRLDKGEISSPLRSAGGFHIIKLIDKKTQKHIVKQTHARHILVRADAITSDDKVRKIMATIKQRLEKGEDFAILAREFSQDPGSKDKGGDLGWAKPGSFVPRFEKVMDSLAINQISEPFKSQYGWHIMQVLERRQQDETDALLRQRAQSAIQQRKAEEELELWIRRIRDEAYVEYRINLDS